MPASAVRWLSSSSTTSTRVGVCSVSICFYCDSRGGPISWGMPRALLGPMLCMAGVLAAQSPIDTIDQSRAGLSIQWQQREQRFYILLAEKLKTQFPKLPALLAADPPRESDADAMQAHLQMLTGLMDKSRVIPKPMFLLLADRLAALLGAAWDPRSQPLERNFNVGSLHFGQQYTRRTTCDMISGCQT